MSCDPGYYFHNDECLEINQIIFYHASSTTTIYKYGIKPSGEGVYLDQFQLPYIANIYKPHLIYNSDLEVVEIIGNWDSVTNDHFHMSVDGEFTRIDPTAFSADYSYIVFTPNVGTISVGGGTIVMHNQAVYIITPRSDWGVVSNPYLSSIQGASKTGFAITTDIYLKSQKQ